MILSNDTWTLAPAYDLLHVSIVLPEDIEELALTLGGKKKLSKAYFDVYGQSLGLNKKQVEGVYKRLIKNKSLALKWIKKLFLSVEMKGKYMEVLEEK